ncbi:MAG TPA: hypothetical protein VFE38_16585 [Edaphobacter sp.]|nr:hypothetical protein [Edaphobacter sp.]
MRAAAIVLLLAAFPISALAQNESRLHRDFRVEAESLSSCKKLNFGSLADCGQTLVMGQPMHISVGSLAPQNGLGFGLAFVEHKNFANEWRTNYNIDAQATLNGSWRAGAYMKAYRLPGGTTYKVAPLFGLYSQSISLTRVDYYGLGPNTLPATHTTYGFSENITGVSAIMPLNGVFRPARIAIVAELNGRFPSLRPGSESSIPSTSQIFTETTAPGLVRQTAYFQPSEGVRIAPGFFKNRIRLNYLLQFQQYVAPGNSAYSFRRWNADFNHEIPLYSLLPSRLAAKYYTNRASQIIYNGPDDCTGSSAGKNIPPQRAAAGQDPARPCPVVSTPEKLEGSISLRLFLSESFANRGSTVPFYLMPTLGGSDINGTPMLASYPDYRFRAPNLLLLRGTIEHSIGKLPIGALFSVDEGKVAMRRDDIAFDHLRHSFNAGLTVHAGGLPVFYLLFAWGGSEGSHTTANISPALLGGGSRPSLF